MENNGNNFSKNYKIELDLAYLEEAIGYAGRSLVGKLLKRYEIVSAFVKDGGLSKEDLLKEEKRSKELLKNISKELIHEQLRALRDVLIAYGRGLQITQFNFKAKKSE